jgi:molybdopterin-guanine dinucleotide biosynthesis protein A
VVEPASGREPPPRRDQIAGLVLAGGQGRRMGGVDKGLQRYHDEPLALRAARRLEPQVAALSISANRHLDEYRGWGWPVLQDEVRHHGRGPLAGLLAGLEASPREWLACVPCDVPQVPTDLVARLAAAAPGHQVVFAAAVDPTTDDGRPRRHPVCCLLHRSLRAPLATYLDSGGRRIDAWMRSLAHAEVVFDDAAAFANLNTQDDLTAAQRR